MDKKTHALDIHISKEELKSMTPEEHDKFIDMIYEAMTPEQRLQMANIGKRVIEDDVLQHAKGRSRTALRTMARVVHVTVNEVE